MERYKIDHELKIEPKYYNEVISGRKRFEVRKDDRNFKIGAEFEAENDFKIKSMLCENETLHVKKGDEGFIDKNGFIHWLTGEGRGKIQEIESACIKGYDIDNIAKLIADALIRQYGLEDYLENEDIQKDEFEELIVSVLEEIF